ncbi:MAG TPA: hypothetical protein EYP33_05105 [Pyrodictium sp.]|nr:hypothetical protein [Pyrodictium sp.]
MMSGTALSRRHGAPVQSLGGCWRLERGWRAKAVHGGSLPPLASSTSGSARTQLTLTQSLRRPRGIPGPGPRRAGHAGGIVASCGLREAALVYEKLGAGAGLLHPEGEWAEPGTALPGAEGPRRRHAPPPRAL